MRIVAIIFMASWLLLFVPTQIVAAFVPTEPVEPTIQPASVLIINQVRGTECCNPGSLDAFQQQLAVLVEQQLPAYVAFRYDALHDQQLINAFERARQQNPQLKPAAMIEITPTLAEAAGVPYAGTIDHWYQAQQAYTIGYQPTDRQAIIDTLMARFNQQFHTYPELTSAWLIDTQSAHYLHQQYAVSIHQTTREQWGLDSYTLYGGPFQVPYFAGREWLFMPNQETSGLVIVRQTVMDPLWVYGDTTSAFTSQPNDYILDGKQIDYFERLIEQSITQPSPSLIVLGLETSMPPEIQTAYQTQLRWISSLIRQNRLSTANKETISHQARQLKDQPQLKVGRDLTSANSGAISYWITTHSYRVRLLVRHHQVWITDLRIYNSDLIDPYHQTIAEHGGFWVTPFLIDSSLTHDSVAPRPQHWLAHLKSWLQPRTYLNNLRSRLRPPDVTAHILPPVRDFQQARPHGLALPNMVEAEPTINSTDDAVTISYTTADDHRSIEFKFTSTAIDFIGLGETELRSSWPTIDQKVTQVLQPHRQLTPINAHHVRLTPQISNQDWQQLQLQAPEYFFPEIRMVANPDPTKSIFYIHNRYALSGKNPVRLVMALKDERGRPVGLTQPAHITATYQNPIDHQQPIIDQSQTSQQDVQFVDIRSFQPGAVDFTVTIGDSLHQNQTVYFAPDCKQTYWTCLTHPRQAWWYVRAKWGDRWRSILD